MSEIFFTSDTHFSHKGILHFDSTKTYRPFLNIEDHDEFLIDQWNKTVGLLDKVFHLGDFCFGKANLEIAGRLNGFKHLIMGNHDHYATCEYLEHFDKLSGAHEYKGMILTHIPVHPNQLTRYYMNIHGHMHTNHVLKPDGNRDYRYFNACVENHALKPIPLDEIYNYWAEHREDK